MTTNNPTSSYIQMACYSIGAFANDGAIDLAELDHLLSLATADGQIDLDEKRVFLRILDAAETPQLPGEVRSRIHQLRRILELVK